MALNRYKRWLELAKLDHKSYQETALKWCLKRELNGGGLLADEMGLGKTYVMMGLIAADPKQTLVVVPPALLAQWTTALTKHLHPPAVYHGLNKNKAKKRFNFSPIILTTYNLLLRADIKERQWERVIYDEAHHLRNKKSKKFKGAAAIKTGITWLLTGTPIQNRKSDLSSLCKILKISVSQIKDAMLRRTVEQVGLQLPKLVVHHENIEWETPREKNFALDIHSLLKLTAVTNRNANAILGSLNRVTRSTFPAVMRARQVCILPELVQQNLAKWVENGVIDEDWLTNGYIDSLSTSKLDAVVSTITKRNNGRKKLIFCHFRKEIDELAARLKHLKVGIIDGRTKKKDRGNILNSKSSFSQELCDELLDKFVPNKGSDFVFKNITNFLSYDVVLLQIQTCCEGLNLQQFQEVYFTSPHWNPAVEDQAIARCYRQGQTEEVDVFKFCMTFGGNMRTLDQYCQEVQEFKKGIYSTFNKS